ncbi:MAG: serine/threonine-protein kinase, partial [Rhizobacter sp.]
MTHADQVLYSNDHARVSRRKLPGKGGSVIVKQAVGAPAIRRLAHETGMLKRLSHIEGVPHLASEPTENDTVLLVDIGGVSLTEFLRERTLGVAEIVAYAAGVARILAQVHKAGVIHKDIGPGNLLIHPKTLAPALIDFNIAALASTEQAGTAAEGEIAGTWAYMSPEHTGRTGRAPDSRSDLYSLGITLYQALVGHKPFESEDLLELVHAHLVQMPDAPAAVNTAVPQIVSDVVMRLLAKEPEKRYQSAEGLAQDLQRVQRGLAAGQSEAFELGAFDFGAELKTPAALVGREAETKALRAALDATAAGRTPWLWISGPAGAGKSALVEELRAQAATRRAWYAGGRFTPDSTNVPMHAFGGFSGLGRQLLALPADQLAQVRERLLAALEGRLGYGVAQLPEFQSLLGEHPAAEPEGDAETAMADAAVRLLRTLASAERPLVMVADDLHVAPHLTYKVLATVAAEAAREPIPGLLLVGAGRDGLADDHALSVLLADARAKGQGPTELAVAPLAAAAAGQLVAAMLRMPKEDAAPLADALSRHTQHRPGRIVELL